MIGKDKLGKYVEKYVVQGSDETPWDKIDNTVINVKYGERKVLDGSTESTIITTPVNKGGKVAVVDNGEVKETRINSIVTLDTVDTADVFGDNSNVATYKFDGDANDLNGNYNGTWKDKDGNTIDGSYDTGMFDQAAKFDGNGYVELDLNNPFKNDFSITVWHKSLKQTGDDEYDLFLASDTDHKLGSMYKDYVNGYEFRWSIGNGDTWIEDFGPSRSGVLNDLNWHFISLTKTGRTYKFYIDAELVYEHTSNYDAYQDDCPVRIGIWGNGDYYATNNLTDQLRIFNRVLTDDEIQTLYQEQKLKYSISELNLSTTPTTVNYIDVYKLPFTIDNNKITTNIPVYKNETLIIETNDGSIIEYKVDSVDVSTDLEYIIDISSLNLSEDPVTVSKELRPTVGLVKGNKIEELVEYDLDIPLLNATNTELEIDSTYIIKNTSKRLMDIDLNSLELISNTGNININNIDITNTVDTADIFGDNSNIVTLPLDNNLNNLVDGIIASVRDSDYNELTPVFDTGKFDQALKFDSSTTQTLTFDTEILSNTKVDSYTTNIDETATGTFTFSAWVNIQNTDVVIYNTGGAANGLGIGIKNNKTYFAIQNGGTYKSTYGNVNIETNKWYHIVFVLDITNKNVKSYVNGVLDIDYDFDITIGSRASYMYIGNTVAANTFYDDGDIHINPCIIDQYRVFNRVLTEDEVQALYEEQKLKLQIDELPDTPTKLIAKNKKQLLPVIETTYDSTNEVFVQKHESIIDENGFTYVQRTIENIDDTTEVVTPFTSDLYKK